MQMVILEKVRDVVTDVIDIEREKIIPEASLRDDLNADSLASAEIVMALEDEFDIEIDEQLARSVATVGELIVAIETMRGLNIAQGGAV